MGIEICRARPFKIACDLHCIAMLKKGRGPTTVGEGIHSTKAKNPSTGEAGPPPFDKGGFTHINQNLTPTVYFPAITAYPLTQRLYAYIIQGERGSPNLYKKG